jgi:hypothetical protein
MNAARIVALGFAWLMAAAPLPARAADAAFQQFLQSLRPQAEQFGISRATFDAATRDLEPDLSLPDLAIPGRPTPPDRQPEFVQTPADYVRESSLARLATQGRALAAEYRDTLARIEREIGVPGAVVLANLGPRKRLRPRQRGGPRRGPGAGDAGLCRQAQGAVQARVFLRAEDAAGRPGHAGAAEIILGRRHGAHAVPTVGILSARRRFRR